MKRKLSEYPIHLGLGATAIIQPAFTGDMDWYESYAADTLSDGAEGRLVSQHSFTDNWTSWEMHPNGSEIVICVSGTIILIQEMPDSSQQVAVLTPGEYAINHPGVWHTADVPEPAAVIFITAGDGTQHRPR